MDRQLIGQILRERRQSRKIRQEDLADIADVSPRTLRDIEKGVGNPELETLVRLCRVLGLQLGIEVMKG